MTDEKNRYKQTVLLPRTDFPMKADLATREPARRKKWEEMKLYDLIRAARKGAKPWVLHDGPPYANGDAHTGTGMNKILKDIVVKFRTMQGFDSPYVPGWDCHGLPIEHKVLADLGGVKPPNMTVLELRQRCLDYAHGFIDKQRNQFKSTGTLGRWERPYLTIDPAYEANVLQVFASLHERGYITRAKRPVHWSWAAQSALAEAELEYEDRQDPSVYVRFPVSTCGKECKFREIVEARPDREEIWGTLALLIWTTTPWTLPANVAVAASQGAEYVLVRYERDGKREHMVLAQALLSRVAEKAKLQNVNVLEVFSGADLKGVGYSHPFLETACPVVFADYVTLEDGTGLVHTAPGHGKEDFETGKREKLPVVCPIDEAGKFFTGDRLKKELQLSPAFEDTRGWLKMLEGQNVLKANPLIVNKLREEGWLLHTENIQHSYPHCWRTHAPVIFRVTEQWFVQIDHVDPDKAMNPQGKTLRARLLDAIHATKWFPAWGENRISAMIENRPDWCVSRQRYWGIPIPAFRVKETGEVVLTRETNKRVVELVRQHGSNVWFDDVNWPAEKLLPPEVAAKYKGKTLEKMGDIFDVWFEAGSSFQAVMREDAELKDKFPANMYLEGDDQHRGWFQVSLILSVATTGVSPFKHCLTCAFVVDEKGEKGSKSKGNMWPIDQGCKDLGADLIRYYFASLDTSSPVPVTYKLIQAAGDGYRKVRNTFRALAGNLFDFDPARHAVTPDKLQQLDRWVLSRADALIAAVTAAVDRYEFHVALREITQFCNVTLSAQYIDVCKDVLYCEAADSPKRRSAQTACWAVAGLLVRMLAPVLVHTSDEMWEFLPKAPGDPQSVHLASWPSSGDGQRHIDLDLERRFDLTFKVKAEADRVLDRMRKEGKVGKGYDTIVTLGAKPDLLAELASLGVERLAEYFNVSGVILGDAMHHAAAEGYEPAVDVQGLFVKVVPSADRACVRCYRRTGDVGNSANHPELCERCAAAVGDSV
ncbi:MAG: isoleucine--tRNA ligase [Planctomycetota bacterium]|nr:isoleucine--tRNA ligase [Planctomycetota bacterium]GIK51093.1 MAG: isoleucine--tRNA ligase [Planctomycetota bacterium]